jgi:hypothetical protein
MGKECAYCGKKETFPFTCSYCKSVFCSSHRIAESHDCIKTRYVRFIRKTWVRKYGQNITTGLYKVVCDQCGYNSEAKLIEGAGLDRELHIADKGCQSEQVFLDELETNQLKA